MDEELREKLTRGGLTFDEVPGARPRIRTIRAGGEETAYFRIADDSTAIQLEDVLLVENEPYAT